MAVVLAVCGSCCIYQRQTAHHWKEGLRAKAMPLQKFAESLDAGATHLSGNMLGHCILTSGQKLDGDVLACVSTRTVKNVLEKYRPALL